MPFLALLTSIPWSTVLRAALVAALCVLVGLGVHHYIALEDRVTTLTADAVKRDAALAEQTQTISAQGQAIQQWQASLERYRADVERYGRIQSDTAEKMRQLNDKFTREPTRRAITGTAPALAAARINADTARAALLLRCASGATGAECAGGGASAPGDNISGASRTAQPAPH
jgi:hypothetical protein